MYTGELAGPFCYGPGKVDAIEEIAGWEGYDLGLSLRLQRLGQRPAHARGRRPPGGRQPRQALARVAHDRGWPIVIFSRRTRRVVKPHDGPVGAAGMAGAAFAGGIALGQESGTGSVRSGGDR